MAKVQKPRLDPGVVVLGWVSFLSDVASEMIFPLLPDFLTRTLRAGPEAIGLVEGVAEATASFMKMFSGWWSDRVRRRKGLVVAGYGIAALARPLVGLASSWAQVLAIRFSDRVGKGLRTSPRDALLADLAPPGSRGRAYGLQRSMDNAGALAGPLLAALLLKFVFDDERSVFLLAAIPGLAGVALVILGIREPPRPKAAPAAPARVSAPMPRRFWVVIGIFVLFALASSTDAFLLLRAQETGVALWQLPLLWAFFNGMKAATGVPGGILADRFGRVRTITVGWMVYAVSYVGFALLSRPEQAWGLFGFYALFYALTEGAERALVADLVPAELRGRAFGVFHASVGLASLPASILFGVLWKSFGAHVAFLVGAGVALLATATLLVFGPRAGTPAREGTA